jgi:chemotaxis signal transduction protein
VEAIGDVIRTSESQFEPCPETLRGPAKGMIDGVCKLERELLLCLDLDRALDLACA